MQHIIKGKVIRGDGYGKKLGFPTINIERRSFSRLKHKPKQGVYAGYVKLLDTECLTYKAGIVIGPFDKKRLPKIEAHLIGYSGNLYGKVAIFEVGKFIRKFKKFKTERELIAQIKKDLML
jgi:FAD synthase